MTNHLFLFVVLILNLTLTFGCGKNEPTNSPQPLEEPVNKVVEVPKENNDEGLLIFDKNDFLNKDLILGAEIRDVSSSKPIENIGGLIMDFLPTTLIRFQLVEEEKKKTTILASLTSSDSKAIKEETGKDIELRMVKSPYIPWNRLPREYPHHELATVSAKTLENGKIGIKAGDFGKLLTAQSLEGTGISISPLFVEKNLISIDENYLVIPLQAKLSEGGVTISLSYVVHLKRWQPKDTLKRTIHKDYGYFTLFEWGSWGDMGPYQVRTKRFPEDPILAWDLKGRTEPIEYVLMDSVPQEYRSLFKEAIESWNLSFRKAGHEKDVVRVREKKAGEKLLIGDPRKHLIFWETDVFRGFSGAHASFQADPITGEMYHADVYFGGEKLIRALKRSYDYYYPSKKDVQFFREFQTTQDLFPKKDFREMLDTSTKLPLSFSFAKTPFQKICSYEPTSVVVNNSSKITQEEFIRAWLLEVMIHEVGHNWGLRHNFKGSLGGSVEEKRPTNSVMDYNDDTLILNNLFLENPGVYDDEAIRYGYQKDLTGSAEPIKQFPFCTDEDLFQDPRCAPFDAGANPLQESIIPDAELAYIKLMLAEEYLDQVRYLNYFASRFFPALLFLQRQGTLKDKQFLNEAIVKLTELKEVTLPGENTPRDLSKSWLYDPIRPQLTSVPLFLASLFADSQNAVHPVLLNSAKRFIRSEDAYILNISAQMRERLLDILYQFKFHPQKNIQLNVLQTLMELQTDFEKEKASLETQGPGRSLSHTIRLQDVTRFAELVENRIKNFFGRSIGNK